MKTIKDGRIIIEADLDYDWKNADGTWANGTLSVHDSEDEDDETKPTVIEFTRMLKARERDIMNEFGNKYVGLQVLKINGIEVSTLGAGGKYLINAVLDFLTEHPETRFFDFEGTMG